MVAAEIVWVIRHHDKKPRSANRAGLGGRSLREGDFGRTEGTMPETIAADAGDRKRGGGAASRGRTGDIPLTKRLLCQSELSRPKGAGGADCGVRTRPAGLEGRRSAKESPRIRDLVAAVASRNSIHSGRRRGRRRYGRPSESAPAEGRHCRGSVRRLAMGARRAAEALRRYIAARAASGASPGHCRLHRCAPWGPTPDRSPPPGIPFLGLDSYRPTARYRARRAAARSIMEPRNISSVASGSLSSHVGRP